MLSQHQMPIEYQKTRSYVYCNDCEKKCWAKYHFLYHSCNDCKGYNTKLISTQEFKDEPDLYLVQMKEGKDVSASSAESRVSTNSSRQLE